MQGSYAGSEKPRLFKSTTMRTWVARSLLEMTAMALKEFGVPVLKVRGKQVDTPEPLDNDVWKGVEGYGADGRDISWRGKKEDSSKKSRSHWRDCDCLEKPWENHRFIDSKADNYPRCNYLVSPLLSTRFIGHFTVLQYAASARVT